MSEAETELRKLCDKYPSFPPEEREADHQWLLAQVQAGRLGGVAVKEHLGKLVAVYQNEVVLVGNDETAMRVELAKKFEVHPGRFVLLPIDEHSVPRKAATFGFSLLSVVVVLAVLAIVGIVAMSGATTKSTFSKIGSRVG